jgi:hypothetical protein
MGEGRHVWLYGANEANTKVFNRALLAKVSSSPDLFFGFYTQLIHDCRRTKRKRTIWDTTQCWEFVAYSIVAYTVEHD